MRVPRCLLCVLECARAVVELVGLESPWLVSGHTSILARYYDHKNGCLQHDSALQRLSQCRLSTELFGTLCNACDKAAATMMSLQLDTRAHCDVNSVQGAGGTRTLSNGGTWWSSATLIAARHRLGILNDSRSSVRTARPSAFCYITPSLLMDETILILYGLCDRCSQSALRTLGPMQRVET